VNNRKTSAGTRLDPATRRQQILDAAISYFAEAGFGVQTRELTRRIGVSQPLLYRYFPSKQDLINAVFDAVFMGRFDDNWIALLRDPNTPLRDRLLHFYERYAKATYRPEWIRIYMYAGLADMGLNRNYLNIVRKKLLTVMCEEFRLAFVPAKLLKEAPPITGREIELVWNLHGSMFYWGVRQNIFNSKSAASFEIRTADAIDLFLSGAAVHYPLILEEAVLADKKKSR
jgi:AcrR family transcriptional regulator